MRQVVRIMIIIAVLSLGGGAANAQANLNSSWTNFPQSNTFIPIAVWNLDASNTAPPTAGYSSGAAAMAGLHINVALTIGYNGVNGYPASGTCGVDSNNELSNLHSNGVYAVLFGDYTSTTSSESINCQSKLPNFSSVVIGWFGSDEPSCTTMANVPTYKATLAAEDSTRPIFWNFTDWVWGTHGGCTPASNPTNASALQGSDIGSFDEYPVISPWNGSSAPVVTGSVTVSGSVVTLSSGSGFVTTGTWANQPIVLNGTLCTISSVTDSSHLTLTSSCGSSGTYYMYADAMWIQGWSVGLFGSYGRPGQPRWAYMDTGNDAFAYSSQNSSTCSQATNLCTPHANEYRATPEQVNAEVWMSFINGAMGIEWFCEDGGSGAPYPAVQYNWCLGGTSHDSATSAIVAANLKYVDSTILSFAPELNSAVTAMCTMNTGTGYMSYTNSCSNNGYSMSTSVPTVPGSMIIKNYNNNQYIFADADRMGSANFTFTLGSSYAGSIAKVVYDSNSEYDSSHDSTGATFTLNGNGAFTDTLGGNGHNYEPKIYEISGSGATSAPSPSSGLVTAVR